MYYKLKNNSNVYGGQEKYLEMLASKLNEQGYKVYYEGQPNLNIKNAEVENNESYTLVLNGNSALYKSCGSFFKKREPNCLRVVYVQHSDMNDNQTYKYKIFIRYILMFFLLYFVDKIIRVSPTCFPDFLYRKKVRTIINGVSIQKTLPIRKKSHNIDLLMVGTVNKNKNQKLAIDLLKTNKRFKLTIVGGGGYTSNLKEYSEVLNVGDRINWVDFTKNIDSYYKEATFLLMLSFNEAMPLVVLESMSYGLPVISVPVGGVPSIINNYENGVIVDNYYVSDLSNEIVKLFSNEQMYQRISYNSFYSIKDKYSLDKMIEQFIQVTQA